MERRPTREDRRCGPAASKASIGVQLMGRSSRRSRLPDFNASLASVITVCNKLPLIPARIESGKRAHLSSLRKARDVAR